MEDNILKLPKSLTKDENITLFKKMLNSSKEEAEEIRKNIITGNLRLVVETIKKYRNNVEDQKDLFQIGCIGLIKAVDTFDITKNMMFSTYATVCISNRVKEYLRKWNMNCGVLGQLKIKIDEYSDEIYKTTGVNPTTEQISEYFNIPHNKVCKALNIRQIESLDNKLIDSESASYADLISTDENIEEEYIKKCERQIIKKFINKLKKNETIDNLIERTASKYAVVTLTAMLINLGYKDYGINLDIEGIRDLLIDTEINSIQRRGVNKKAEDFILQYVERNASKFKCGKDGNPNVDYWGSRKELPGGELEITILSDRFEEIMKEGKFEDKNVVLNQLKEEGKLDYEEGRLSRKRKINAIATPVYVIKLKLNER